MRNNIVKALMISILFALILSGCSPRPSFPSETLGSICYGEGITGTAPRTWEGNHPIAIAYQRGDTHPWNNRTPSRWIPASLEELQLVACIGEEEEESIQVCPYTGGPSITRYRSRVLIWLVEASTGALIDSRTFYGSEPRECRQSEEVSLTELRGPEVKFDEIKDWLQIYVESSSASDGVQAYAGDLISIGLVDNFDSAETLGGFLQTWWLEEDSSQGALPPPVCDLDHREGQAKSGTGSLHLLWNPEVREIGTCVRGPKAVFNGELWRQAKGISFWIKANHTGGEVTFWIDSGYSGTTYPVRFTTPEISTTQWTKITFLWEQFVVAEGGYNNITYPFDPAFVNMYGFELNREQLDEGLELWVDEIELIGR